MQFVDELEGIGKYKQLNFVEFLEFIGRLADLIYADEPDAVPLAYDVKVWRLMQALFRGIQKRVTTNEDNENIDSESDYEDDTACEIVQKRYPRQIYCGYGLMQMREEKETKEESKATLIISTN